jgi:hypothetical protein
MLVQRPRLTIVLEPSRELNNAMGNLMAGNINDVDEVVESLAIAISKNYPGTIPKRVIFLFTEMN